MLIEIILVFLRTPKVIVQHSKVKISVQLFQVDNERMSPYAAWSFHFFCIPCLGKSISLAMRKWIESHVRIIS